MSEKTPDLAVFCVSHKAVDRKLPDGYIELGVGGYQSAQFFTGTGDHINQKNDRYSEVSAIYWVLKNFDLDSYEYVGLVHYRRFFSAKLSFDENESPVCNVTPSSWNYIRDLIARDKIRQAVEKSNGMVPTAINFGRSLASFYREKHHSDIDLRLAYEHAVRADLFTKETAVQELNSNFLTPFCMSILKTEIWVNIWEKILDVLFEIESKVSRHQDPYQNRNLGFIAERLHSSALVSLQRSDLFIRKTQVFFIDN